MIALDDQERPAQLCSTLLLSPGPSERLPSRRRDDCGSSISAVSAVLTDTLASMTKHSCRAFAHLRLTPDTGT
jgi:hypothetical protein